jgi:hypothetical protein
MNRSYFDTYQSGNLSKGIGKGVEIMFHAPVYHLLAVHSGETFTDIMAELIDEKFRDSVLQLNTWTTT